MTDLRPAELIKGVDRVETLINILKKQQVLYSSEGLRGEYYPEDPKVCPENYELIELLQKLKNNLPALAVALSGGIDKKNPKKVVVQLNGVGPLIKWNLNQIQKDARFIKINMGHVFESVLGAGFAAAIKKRPHLADCNVSDTFVMPDISEKDIINVIEEVVQHDIVSFDAIGCQGEHDVVTLFYETNSLAIQGLKQIFTDRKKWREKKNSLIQPALAFLHSENIHSIRERLYLNGIVDYYNIGIVGGEQQKADIQIEIKTKDKKLREKKTSLYSLKFSSVSTFGTVKGSGRKELQNLFNNFNISIGKSKNICSAYEKAAQNFNAKSLAQQLNSIQKALEHFYAKGMTSIEVLKFTKNDVFKRSYAEFTNIYELLFKDKKMVAKLEPELPKTNDVKLKFCLPYDPDATRQELRPFLQIRCRLVENSYRHEIEDVAGGMKIVIGEEVIKKMKGNISTKK